MDSPLLQFSFLCFEHAMATLAVAFNHCPVTLMPNFLYGSGQTAGDVGNKERRQISFMVQKVDHRLTQRNLNLRI
ncbi:hypothetical protein Ddc_10466 [Ditylenchus destructor]|nr:hypothetical protein Ddc_10466 [Ditylenchus destructor]